MDEILWVGMSVAAATLMVIAPVALSGLAVPYLIVRLKTEPPEDTQLGAKIAFQFFFSAGILVMLSGVTILAVDWLTLYPYRYPQAGHPLFRTSFGGLVDQGFNVAQRTAVGLILSGAVAVVAHLFLLHTLTGTHRLRVQRLFVGWRLAIHGVVVMLALAAVIVLLLQKNPFEEPVESPLRAATATFVVWGISWAVHLERLLTLTKRRKREQEPASTDARPAPRISPPDPVVRPPDSIVPPAVSIALPAVSIAPSAAAGEVHPWPDEPMTINADMLATPALTILDLEAPLHFPNDEAPAAAPETPRADSPPPLPPPLPPPSDAEASSERPPEPSPDKPSDANGAA